jgi:hypothetical protein
MEKLTVLEALVPIYHSAWHFIREDQNFHECHYYLPIVIQVTASRRTRLMEHIAHIGKMRNAYSILVEKSEYKRPLGRCR